jgi:cytoskeleton protein RodZ
MSDLDAVPDGQSDSEAAGAGFSGSGTPATVPTTAGTLLRQAREAAGMHIAALAVSLKVPVKKLEALEQDRFDLLPDAVFVRALASSVCRTLKLDAAPVLGLLPQTSAPKLTYQGSGINAPFRTPGEGPSPSVWTQVSKQAVLAGLLLLLGALVLIFMPAMKQDGSNGKNDADTMPPSALKLSSPCRLPWRWPDPGLPTTSSRPCPRRRRMSRLPPPVRQRSGPSSTLRLRWRLFPCPCRRFHRQRHPAPAPPGVALQSPPATAAAPAAPALAASQAAPAGIVTFRAKGDSWVEVTDAKGTSCCAAP